VAYDKLISNGEMAGGVHGVCIMEDDKQFVKDLQDQNGLYGVMTDDGSEQTYRVVGSLVKISHGPSETEKIIEAFAAPNIKIISLTVTEKGYRYTKDRKLNIEDPVIAWELENKDALPKSMLGYLFAVAKQRKADEGEPFTVMSSDNIVSNGDLTRDLLLDYAKLMDPNVRDWIEKNVSFPNSMVDRITPNATDKTVALVQKTSKVAELRPVLCEPFFQWVLEENFINGRPPLELAGVEMVPNAKPYEKLKTGLLNGTGSALGFVAHLMGYEIVHEAMQDDDLIQFVTGYMDQDVTPTLDSVLPLLHNINVKEYKQTLLRRFSNPAIGDRIMRFGEDSSVKFRAVIVPPLREQLANEGTITHIAFAVAAWAHCLVKAQKGELPAFKDEVMDGILANKEIPIESAADFLIGQEAIFGDLSGNHRLTEEVTKCYNLIQEKGIRKALTLTCRTSS
jgi:mannitol 2-dehydrogenase